MKNELYILRLFNEKLAKLERTGFAKRYKETVPEVVAKFDDVVFEPGEDGLFSIAGRIESWVPEFNQDEIDAFVLTFRMLTQRNDQISLPALAKIYEKEWMPGEARSAFTDAHKQLNVYLDSAATIQLGESRIAIRTILEVTIYGGLAHTNKEKERAFRAWMQEPGTAGFFWVEFIAALKEMMRYFAYFKSLNEAVLETVLV